MTVDAPPPLPAIRLEVTEDYTAQSRPDEGYLRVRRRKMRAHHADGTSSEEFKYDVVERWNQDAVAILLHFVRDGARHVILRSAVRPPLAMRDDWIAGEYPDGVSRGELWEIPAGLVEQHERDRAGLVACAVRETEEEVGLHIRVEDVRPLGGAFFPSAGVVGECVFLFEAEVDPRERPRPEGDGPLEKGASVVEVPLSTALAWCDRGALPDAKTELALRRLAARKPETTR
ncbi:MAG: NUDIX hydrolase [Deltaproteobacteria bacterium]|nr:NUDIX hydrolase [Deltaproteobacteria bacterium]